MFYLTLPSNSSLSYFPNNTASHFFTKLPQEIRVSGEWEVGLAEIQFTNNYENVPHEQVFFDYFKTGPPKDVTRLLSLQPSGSVVYKDVKKRVRLNNGIYASNEAFIEILNKASADAIPPLPNNRPAVRFEYNSTTKKVSLHVYEDNVTVILSELLQDIIGFEERSFSGVTHTTAPNTIDIQQDFRAILIYCDLVTPRPVGDAMVPLLRTLPIVDKTKDVFHMIFDKPHYIPLHRLEFHSVEIFITADTGREISFSKGHTIATLHFRQRKLEY